MSGRCDDVATAAQSSIHAHPAESPAAVPPYGL
jgi:hypothetical protein